MNDPIASYLNTETAAVKSENGFDRLEAAKKCLLEAQGRAGRLADRLVGEAGDGKSDSGMIGPGGLLGSLDVSARDIAAIAQKIIEDISRIENRL